MGKAFYLWEGFTPKIHVGHLGVWTFCGMNMRLRYGSDVGWAFTLMDLSIIEDLCCKRCYQGWEGRRETEALLEGFDFLSDSGRMDLAERRGWRFLGSYEEE